VEQKTPKAITLEELRRILRVIGEVASGIRVGIDLKALESLTRLGNRDLENELMLELDQVRAELAEKRISAIATLIKVALDSLNVEYTEVEAMYPDELAKLYREKGFEKWVYDECTHFGLAETTEGTALIYTCEDEPPFKLEVAVNGVVIE
jgi:DNA polymerase III psi subunit